MSKYDDFSLVGRDLYMLGLVDSIGGSISVREGSNIYITKRGAMLGHLKEGDIIELPLEGESADDDKASRELPVHRAIFRETNFNAIISANPPYAVALSINTENKIMPQDMKGQAVLRSVPVVKAKSFMSGRDRMVPDDMVKLLPPVYKSGYSVSVVKEYGSFAIGADLFEALQYTTCLEASSKVMSLSKNVTPPEKPRRHEPERRSAIPPGIGVMDRTRGYKRGFGR